MLYDEMEEGGRYLCRLGAAVRYLLTLVAMGWKKEAEYSGIVTIVHLLASTLTRKIKLLGATIITNTE